MWMKSAGLKKLMKEAYKGGGLDVGFTQGMIYLEGAYWRLLADLDVVDNKTLAAIVELARDLPPNQERFLVSKEGKQIELWDDTRITSMQEQADTSEGKLSNPGIVLHIQGEWRLLQEVGTGVVRIVQERIWKMIDQTSCLEGESWPSAPSYRSEDFPGVYIASAQMVFAVSPCKFPEQAQDLKSYLEKAPLASLAGAGIWSG